MLLERAARHVGTTAGPRRHQLLDELVRVRRTPAAGLHHLLGVFVEREQWLGRQVVLDDDEPRPGRVVEPDQPLPQLHGHRVRTEAVHPDLLDAEAFGCRGQAAGDPLDLVDGEVERRPHVEQHTVPVVPTFRRERGLNPAHPLEGVEQHPLELRQGDDPSIVVAYGRQVADLAHRQQTLVLGVGVGDGADEVDVLGGRQTLDGEVGQAPQMQPLDHQRMETVDRVILDQAGVGTGCERQMPHRAEAVRRAGAADGHDHPLRAGGQRRREGVGQPRRRQRIAAHLAIVFPRVHVERDGLAGRNALRRP